jgi:hypothetical protein
MSALAGRLVGRAEFAWDNHIEWGIQHAGYLIANYHSATRHRQHDYIIPTIIG